jgi:chorismate-pyruvate lyase
MPDNFAYPLSDFYQRAKLPLPAHRDDSRRRRARAVQITARSQERHDADAGAIFTTRASTSNCSGAIGAGSFYYREVVLRLDHDEKPVEFGANKVFLGQFPEAAQEQILLEQVPLGRILKECGVRHVTEAKHFSACNPDALILKALELETPVTLYGRKAVISDLQGHPLSEIVEILPPG